MKNSYLNLWYNRLNESLKEGNTQTVYVVKIPMDDGKGNSIPWEIGRFDRLDLAQKEADKIKDAWVETEEEDLW